MTQARKISCLRGLEGIPCAGQKTVRKGLLYRSGHLGKLDPKKAPDIFGYMGIRHIADLRSDSEVLDISDVTGGAEYHRFTPLDDSLNPAVTPKTRMKILSRLMAKEGGTLQHLCDTYRKLVTLPDARAAYSSLLRLLIESEGGVLWHCTQGKDRTGMGTVAILLALGASREDIMADYLNYNSYCRFRTRAIFFAVTLLKFSTHTAKQLNNLMTARAEYLSAAFDEMDRSFGGTDGYLRNGLGLSDEDIIKLREIYLD